MRQTVQRVLPGVVALALLAGGCDDTPAPADSQGAGAEGEVLEGTISDAMLPLDRVRTQAPVEDPSDETDTEGADEDGETATSASDDAGETDAEADAAGSPADEALAASEEDASE